MRDAQFRNEVLVKQVEGIPDLEAQLKEKDSQLQAKDLAIDARLGGVEGDIEPIGGIGWGLCFAEYWHRTKQFHLVSTDARRSRTDKHGNKWSLQAFPRMAEREREGLSALDDEQKDQYTKLASALGYDPNDPPADAWLLHCQPNKGSYDIAETELEKAQRMHLTAQRNLFQAQKAVQAALARGNKDLAQKAGYEVDAAQEAVDAARDKFSQCKAIIENAIQRYYLVTLSAMEKFAEYQMPLVCYKADVIPQKRFRDLPTYTEPEAAYVPPADGVPR